MIEIRTIKGTYGSQKEPCLIYVAEVRHGAFYCVEGSTNVNATDELDRLVDGCDVEWLDDYDTFQADEPITCEDDMKVEVEDYLSY